MDYITTSIFFPECLQNFTDYATMLFLTPGMLQNFMDCATTLVFPFRNVAKLYKLHNDGCLNILRRSSEIRMPTNNDPRTKLGYDRYATNNISS